SSRCTQRGAARLIARRSPGSLRGVTPLSDQHGMGWLPDVRKPNEYKLDLDNVTPPFRRTELTLATASAAAAFSAHRADAGHRVRRCCCRRAAASAAGHAICAPRATTTTA